MRPLGAEERIQKDHKRDGYLTSCGFQVVRFKNSDFFNSPQQVLNSIAEVISSPSGRGRERVNRIRDRRGEVLFLDARNLGYMKDRVLRDFKPEEIAKIADTFHAWQTDPNPPQSPFAKGGSEKQAETPPFEKGGSGGIYQDIPGFCCSATLDDIRKHDFVLTPGRYVGAADEVEDGEPFAEKMSRLTAQLQAQFARSSELEEQIKRNLAGLGFDMEESA